MRWAACRVPIARYCRRDARSRIRLSEPPIQGSGVLALGRSRRQHHRIHAARICNRREMVGVAQGACARVKRVAVIYHADNPASAGYLATIAPAAPTFGVDLITTGVRNVTEIERAIDAIAGTSDGGIIVMPGPAPSTGRGRIIALAEQHRLPAVSLLGRKRRLSVLRYRQYRALPPCSDLCRPHPQGREVGRSAGATRDQVPPGHQSENRQGVRLGPAANHAACAHRRGDRMRRREFVTLLGSVVAT
jgi:hypothetical protein